MVGGSGAPGFAWSAFLEKHQWPIVIGLIVVASARIIATYAVFSQTFDEPAHIACGMEWLSHGTYQYEAQHPPLARVMSAVGPFLLGVRSQGTPNESVVSKFVEGNAILSSGHQYDRNLAAARAGILPFFWIACLVVFVWAKRDFGASVAVVAVFLFSFLPPVLAHAGLATTDMAVAAFLGAAFLAGMMWLDRPTLASGAWFGASTGLAILAKFSTLAFFPVMVAVALLWYWAVERPSGKVIAGQLKERAPTFAVAIAVCVLLIAAAYRFSLGPLFSGIQEVLRHNAEGHPAFLLGERSQWGFWYFYPVVLAVKTPLAFLLALAAGVVLAVRSPARFRRSWTPLAFAGGILLVAFFSHINIGVRHILPVYLAFSIVAAAAMVQLESQKWARIAVPVLAIWFAASSLWSHPDYLAYFNEMAGSEPEKVLVESDLDWGQDMKRLSRRLSEAGAHEVTFTPFVPANYEELGFPAIRQGNPAAPSPGWNAVSLTLWKARRLGLLETHPEIRLWPDQMKNGERVGKSTLLWYFPPGATAR